MPQQSINYGGYDGDQSAEKIRTAFQKVQEMFTEVYGSLSTTGLAGYVLKNVIDPTGVNNDAFNMGYMKESTTKKVLTGAERTNWQQAYDWGDHSQENYIKSFTEADPVFSAWLLANTWKVESFEATAGQVVYIVAETAIVDNGRYKIWVNGVRWYATNGVVSFADGLVTIVYATGNIAFNEALRAGDKIIIEYI